MLRALDKRRRAAFAAACAQRLASANASSAPEFAQATLARLWEGLLSEDGFPEQELAGVVAKCEELVAAENALVNLQAVAADDALAALIFALQTLQGADEQSAMWAARRVWDSIDWYLSHEILPVGTERELRSHPLVQSEIRRQVRDRQLLVECGDPSLPMVVEGLRRTAIREANEVFAPRSE